MEIEDVNEALLARAEELAETEPKDAIRKLREFLKARPKDAELDQYQERALYLLMKCYAITQDSQALVALLKDLRESFEYFSKSKRENIVRNIFMFLSSIPNTDEVQIAVCTEYIEYFRSQNRTSLRQRFEVKLASLLTKNGDHSKALNILNSLSSEVKKVDDKLLLVEIYLTESQAFYALNNITKSKSSLTASRTNANSVYVGVNLQSDIELQAGILNMFEKDYRTSFSYLYEAFEGFSSLTFSKHNKNSVSNTFTEKALKCLEYMILVKTLSHEVKTSDLTSLLNSKNAVNFISDKTIKLLLNISNTVRQRSLKAFNSLLENEENKVLIKSDQVLSHHISHLKEELLERNLIRIVQPYSRVDVETISKLIELPTNTVLSKLSEMILDEKFKGILDQGLGELIVFDDNEEIKKKSEKVNVNSLQSESEEENKKSEDVFEESLKVIDGLNHVVGNLIRRANMLQSH